MSVARDLSFELLTMIFQHLPQQSLVECQIVCKTWQEPATRCFLESITFQNERNAKDFLNSQTASDPKPIYDAVKKITLTQGSRGRLEIEDVQRLMIKVPNLEELELNSKMLLLSDLNNINLPPKLNSINFNAAIYHTAQDVIDYIGILTKRREMIRKFTITNQTVFTQYFLNNNINDFFGLFPQLLEIDISKRRNFGECLQIIRRTPPTLRKARFFLNNDINGANNITEVDKEKLNTLEKLEINSKTFLPKTFLPKTFAIIANNCINLTEINARFNKFIIENSNRSAVLVEFLEFIYFIDTFNIKFRTDQEFFNRYLRSTIFNMFTQLPENNENASMHLYIKISTGNRTIHSFELTSQRDYCNRIKRNFYWDLTYKSNERDQAIACIESITGDINVNTFTFEVSNQHRPNDPRELCNLLLQKLNIV